MERAGSGRASRARAKETLNRMYQRIAVNPYCTIVFELEKFGSNLSVLTLHLRCGPVTHNVCAAHHVFTFDCACKRVDAVGGIQFEPQIRP